jgi:hypothetical protein
MEPQMAADGRNTSKATAAADERKLTQLRPVREPDIV